VRRLAVALTALSMGCAVGPDHAAPPLEAGGGFAVDTAAWASPDEVVPAWWTLFADPQLEALVEAALVENHDVRVAIARVREARAFSRETTFELAPIVTAQTAYERVDASERTALGREGTLSAYDLFQSGFDATWELDFFGRVRRSIEATRADAAAAEEALADVRVTLVGDVARSYFTARGNQEQLAVARRNAENQRKTLELTEALLAGGRGTALDTSRARAQWAATEATIPPLEAAIRVTIHRLGVLTGRTPDVLVAELAPPAPIPRLPESVRLGDVEGFLRRRPDVRAAERALAAATARVGVATADLYPRVTFVGSFGVQADALSGLGAAGSGAVAFGPRITWAAFDLGRVRERVVAADARAEAQLAVFEQTVLFALEEVDNALVTYGRELEQAARLRESAEASARATELARIRYQDGVSDFLTMLDAERRQLEAEDFLARSETRAAVALAAVFKALAAHR